MQKNKRYEWDKMEGCERIRDTEMVNQPLYYDLETVASLLNQQDKRIKELEEENQQLKQKAIVPKFQIGQTLYMIPTQFNGLIKIKEYGLLSIDLSDIGIRYHLVVKEKERGIEPFYCASEAMFGHSIFATKEEAEMKLAEIGGEDE